MTKLLLIFAAVAALGACGDKSAPSPAKPTSPAPHSAGTPELDKFHDVLAPRWHAAKGDQRMKDTCAALPEFRAAADALTAAAPPAAADPAKWTAGTGELTSSLGPLEASCTSNDAAAFEPAFEKVHTSFHGLMEAAGGHHGEHGEKGEHGAKGEHGEHGGHAN